MLQGENLDRYVLLKKQVTIKKKGVTMLIKITEDSVNTATRGVGPGALAIPRYQYLNSLVSFHTEELTQKQRDMDKVYQEVTTLINASWDEEEGDENREQRDWRERYEEHWCSEQARIQACMENMFVKLKGANNVGNPACPRRQPAATHRPYIAEDRPR